MAARLHVAVDANAIVSSFHVRNCAVVTVKADVCKTTAVPDNLSMSPHTDTVCAL